MSTKIIKGLIKTTLDELNLSLTLRSGQSFRWRQYRDDSNEWIGVIGNRYVIVLTQNPLDISYQVLNPSVSHSIFSDICVKSEDSEEVNQKSEDSDEVNQKSRQKSSKRFKSDNKCPKEDNFYERLIRDYFRLDIDLSDLYKKWSKSDDNFAKVSPKFRGIRILNQKPIESLFSFICSSNNNINRISKMVESLCQTYGQKLYESEDLEPIHAFPDVKSLADERVQNVLKELGFGYRSKYIQMTAKSICDSQPKCPEMWFRSLEQMSYPEARHELMTLSGVGPKVADCIALTGLGHLDVIPVDTHVWQIAVDHYLPHLKGKNKTLTDKTYKEIADFFRQRFGQMAGWAHSVLFCAHLKLQTKQFK